MNTFQESSSLGLASASNNEPSICSIERKILQSTNEVKSSGELTLKKPSAKIITKNGPFGPNDFNGQRISPFQQFIAHEDFGLFILMASKVKTIRLNLLCGNVPNKSDVVTIAYINTRKGQNEAKKTAQFIQSTLLLGPTNVTTDIKSLIISRGTFKITDDLMKEAIIKLTREFNRCMTWYTGVKEKAPPESPPKKRSRVSLSNGKKKQSNSIAIKYSKAQTDILSNWMIAHRKHPFPTADEIVELTIATKLSRSQVINWTTNVRKRNLKATVEKGKKPHHFLDFIFLANDREMKALKGKDPEPDVNGIRKLPAGKKKAKRAPAKKQQKVKNVKVTNKREKPPVSEASIKALSSPAPLPKLPDPGPVNYRYAPLPGPTIPGTPMNMIMQQYSTPIHSQTPWNYHAPIQPSFVPYFHPGANVTTRQVTPPRFELQANMMNDAFGDYLDLKCAEDAFSPITLNDMDKIDISTTGMENDVKKDFEQEVLQEFTQDGLVATPPRSENDDMIWELELNSDISVKDVFKDSSNPEIEIFGCSLSMDTYYDNKEGDITEDDVLDLFNIDDDLDTLKIEI